MHHQIFLRLFFGQLELFELEHPASYIWKPTGLYNASSVRKLTTTSGFTNQHQQFKTIGGTILHSKPKKTNNKNMVS
jgi:hypothetical protein